MKTLTGITAKVLRTETRKEYIVSNIVCDSRPGKTDFHTGDRFSGCVLKNGKQSGRVFNMRRDDFAILEVIEERELPYQA